jgi:hypothetical protein
VENEMPSKKRRNYPSTIKKRKPFEGEVPPEEDLK